jgi:hypothetical protein
VLTGVGLCRPWEFTDGAGGEGRTVAGDKTSLHCDWAASAGAVAKPSKRAMLHHIVPKIGGGKTCKGSGVEGIRGPKV